MQLIKDLHGWNAQLGAVRVLMYGVGLFRGVVGLMANIDDVMSP